MDIYGLCLGSNVGRLVQPVKNVRHGWGRYFLFLEGGGGGFACVHRKVNLAKSTVKAGRLLRLRAQPRSEMRHSCHWMLQAGLGPIIDTTPSPT